MGKGAGGGPRPQSDVATADQENVNGKRTGQFSAHRLACGGKTWATRRRVESDTLVGPPRDSQRQLQLGVGRPAPTPRPHCPSFYFGDSSRSSVTFPSLSLSLLLSLFVCFVGEVSSRFPYDGPLPNKNNVTVSGTRAPTKKNGPNPAEPVTAPLNKQKNRPTSTASLAR